RLPWADYFERRLRVDVGDFWERALFRDDDARQLRHFCLTKKPFPSKSGRKLLQLLDRHRIVNRTEIALLRLGPARVRDLRFEIDDVLGGVVWVSPVQQF